MPSITGAMYIYPSVFGVVGSILFYPILDLLAGIVVSLIVIKIGFDIGRENIQQLMKNSALARGKEEN